MIRNLMYNHGIGMGKYRIGSFIDADFCPVDEAEKAGQVFSITNTDFSYAAEMNEYIYLIKNTSFSKYDVYGTLIASITFSSIGLSSTYVNDEIFVYEANKYIYFWIGNKVYRFTDDGSKLSNTVFTLSMTPNAFYYDPVSNTFLMGYVSNNKSYIDFLNDSFELTQTLCISDSMFNRFGKPSAISYDSENKIIYASDLIGTAKKENLTDAMAGYCSSFAYSLKTNKLLFSFFDEVTHGASSIRYFPLSNVLYQCYCKTKNNVNAYSFEMNLQILDRFNGNVIKLLKSIKNTDSLDAAHIAHVRRSSSSNGLIVQAYRTKVFYYKLSAAVGGDSNIANCERVFAMSNNNSFIANTKYKESSTTKTNLVRYNTADIRKIIY